MSISYKNKKNCQGKKAELSCRVKLDRGENSCVVAAVEWSGVPFDFDLIHYY